MSTVIDLRDDGTWEAALRISQDWNRRALAARELLCARQRVGKEERDAVQFLGPAALEDQRWGQIAFERWIMTPEHEEGQRRWIDQGR